MPHSSITVFASATVANVACGFDVLGFAVDAPGDLVTAKRSETPGVVIESIEGDGGKLSTDPIKNTASFPVIKMLEHLGSKQGISISLKKQMPLGSGLGSSAASSVAALVAVNELLGNPLSRKELLPFAMEGERLACGAAHADNVAPSLLGGFVLIRSYSPLDVISIPTPENLWCTVVHPHVEVRTEDARSILRRTIPLSAAIKQWGNVAGLIAGLFMKDLALLGRSLEDEIVEPLRAMLIPGFYEVKKAALENGALGSSISGSGPSVFALSETQEKAKNIGKAMENAFTKIGLASEVFVSKINTKGPRILSS